MKHDSVTFTLSQEEVFFLLNQVEAQSLQGVDVVPPGVIDEDQRQLVLAAAERALQARGIIVTGDDAELRIDATVRATIHASAFAPSTLTALVRKSGERQIATYTVYHAEPLWVAHTQPAPGLHQFELSPSSPAVLARLGQLLGVDKQLAPPAAPFTIDPFELDQITAAVATETQPLHETLIDAGAEPATAGLFADLLKGPREAALIQMIDRRGDTEDTRTATFMRNQQGFWILEPASPSQLNCRPASAEDVRRSLAGMTEQL